MATALAGLLARDSLEGLCPDCAEHSLFSLHQSDLPEAAALLAERDKERARRKPIQAAVTGRNLIAALLAAATFGGVVYY